MARIDRLSTGDLMTFWAETPTAPMHIALAVVIEHPGGDGDPAVTVADELRRRAARLPELARRVRWTHPGEGPPALVDDPDDVVADHIRVRPPVHLAEPGAFEARAAAVAVEPLDRRRPLWRADLIPDTDPTVDAVGLVVVLHHAIADGGRGLVLAATLFDPAPSPATDPPPANHGGEGAGAGTTIDDRELRRYDRSVPAPGPPPTAHDLVVDNLHRMADSVRYLGSLCRRRLRPGNGRDRRRGGADLRASLRQLRVVAPRTGLDEGPATAQRDLAVVRRPLDRVRAIGHAGGATVNDILLTAVSGGMRELLLAHGEPVEGRTLRVSVPVASPAGTRNAGGSMPIVTDLPVGDPDPRVRLAQIHRDLARRKAGRDPDYRGVGQSPLMPRAVMWLGTRVMRRRGDRMVNLYVTNVRGPTQRWWLGAGEVTRPVPVTPLVGGGRIGVAALSYAGELAVAVHTDRALRHADRLVAGIAATFDQLDRPDRPDGLTERSPVPGAQPRGA